MRDDDELSMHRSRADFGARVKTWLERRSYLFVAIAVQAVVLGLLLLIYRPFRGEGISPSPDPNTLRLIFGASLLLPGVIRRWNWRQLLIALIVGPLAVYVWLWTMRVFHHPYWPILDEIALVGGTAAIVGAIEWLFRPGASWRSLCAVIVTCVATAAVYSMATFIPTRNLVIETFRFRAELRYSCVTLLPWLAMPVAHCLAERRGKPAIICLTTLAVVFAAYFAFFGWGIYVLAERAITDRGPMTARLGIQLLSHRGRDADLELICRRLDHADWDKLFVVDVSDPNWPDWRETAIDLLVRQHPQKAGEYFGNLVVRQPDSRLIERTARVLAHEQRFETVPVMMRFALLGATRRDNTSQRALEKLRVPQAALPLLIYEVARRDLDFAAVRQGMLPDGFDPVDAELRRRLIALLDFDPGEKLDDWVKAYDERAAGAPTPLTDSLRAETESVVDCFRRHDAAAVKWRAHRVSRRGDKLGDEPDWVNWNVPTTEALVREVDRYVAEVDQLIQSRSGTNASREGL